MSEQAISTASDKAGMLMLFLVYPDTGLTLKELSAFGATLEKVNDCFYTYAVCQ